MTLTPEQRAAAIEAMARALCQEAGSNPDRADTLLSVPRSNFRRRAAAAALDAALPIIAAAMVSDITAEQAAELEAVAEAICNVGFGGVLKLVSADGQITPRDELVSDKPGGQHAEAGE